MRLETGKPTGNQFADRIADDAILGSMYEEKWRGPPNLYPKSHWPALVKRALERFRHLPDEGPVRHMDSAPLPSGVGWGSYGWQYSPTIAGFAMRHAVLIDTAEGYGFGKVESALGPIIREYREGNVLRARIATKVARTHMAEESVWRAGVRSREKLGPIDLYQIHWPHPTVPISGTVTGMMRLLEAGVVGSLGVSNFSLDQLYRAQLEGMVVSSIQIRASLLDSPIVDYAQEAGGNVIAHSPFDQGKCTPSLCESVLAGLLLREINPIPGTNNYEHLKRNLWSTI